MPQLDELICDAQELLGDLFVRLKNLWRWFTWQHLLAILIVLAFFIIAGHMLHKRLVPNGMPVTIAKAVKKSVPVFFDYVSQTSAINMVDIVARVDGFLEEPAFKEGSDVNAGDLIFTIDPKPFQAKLDQANGQLKKDEAALAYAREQVSRYTPLVQKDYVARLDYDNYKTQADQAAAAVDADQAAVEQAKLNLGYCWMYSPISGRIGRMYVTLGNMVGHGNDTKLATIVQLDPLYVYFAPSSNDAEAIIAQLAKAKVEVELLMSDGKPFAHRGQIDFVDNKVDSKTSTVTMRAVIPNPEKTLLPGLYLEARIYLGERPDAVLVPERAIAEDQQGNYVMVVKDDNTVEQRHISAGDRTDGERIIDKGLNGGESVIIAGLQLIRPGSQVIPRFEKKEPGIRDLLMKAVLAPKKSH